MFPYFGLFKKNHAFESMYKGKDAMRIELSRVMVGTLCLFGALSTTAMAQTSAPANPYMAQAPQIQPGQSATLLPSGDWLILGVNQASLLSQANGSNAVPLTTHMLTPRSYHTATLLPTGKVLVFGGVDALGRAVASPELFDPSTRQFKAAAIPGLDPRSKHTATVLTTGAVLIAGGIPDATPVLWSPRFNTVRKTSGDMLIPRSGHSATLLSTSPVLISGGVDESGASAAGADELYWRQSDSFDAADLAKPGQIPNLASLAQPPAVAESIPADKAQNVTVEAWPAVRFSRYLDIRTLNANTVTLYGPSGPEGINVNPVDSGMLLFVQPVQQLQPDSDYTLFIRGAADDAGDQLPFTAIGFHTQTIGATSGAAASAGTGGKGATSYTSAPAGQIAGDILAMLGDSVWEPNAYNFSTSWRLGVSSNPLDNVPLLQGAKGVTAISGRVILQNGTPLPGVGVAIGGVTTHTDNLGRFLVQGVPTGHSRMIVDGRTANTARAHYGQYVIGVDAMQGQTTLLNYTVWMPVIDEAHAISIQSPAKAETVVTTPLIPGLELHIPKGAVLRDLDGNIVTKVSITPVPLDRPPFPTPETPGFFTIQPGGAYLQAVQGSNNNPGMKLVYPNSRNYPDGAAVDFENYDPDGRGWYTYGQGKVYAKQNKIQPNSNVVIYQFMGAMYGQPNPSLGGAAGTSNLPPAAPAPDGCKAGGTGGGDPSPQQCPQAANPNSSPTPSPQQCLGDPVDCSTGLFIYTKRDLYLPDTIPIDLTRTYNSGDSYGRNFGPGTTHPYHMYVIPGTNGVYYVVQPNGSYVTYQATVGSGIYAATNTFGNSAGATGTFAAASGPINIKYKTGYTYQFSPLQGHPLSAIISPSGQTLQINVDYTKYDHPILSIVSPNGRSITFTYVPGDDTRIATATDNTGRQVKYGYDSQNRLQTVTYPDGSTETYGYASGTTQLTTVTDGNNNTTITNTYTGQQVTAQQRADGGTFKYAYTAGSNGFAATTTVTDPLGNMEQMTFDSSGYLVKDVQAYGSSLAQTATYVRDGSNSDRITQIQDPQGRKLDFTYDGLSNVKSITQEATSTTPATAAQYSYEPNCNKINVATDSANVNVTYSYDSQCNLVQVQDNMGSILLSVTPDGAGRPHLVKDMQGNTTTYNYLGPDLVSVVDPLGRVTAYTHDTAGRLKTTTDGAGDTYQYQFDQMNRLLVATDPLGNSTSFTYDGVGNLKQVQTPKGTTKYGYYNTELLETRTDPLGNAETYTYDTDFNLTKLVDRNGNTDKLDYDALNRLTTIDYAANILGSEAIQIAYTYGVSGSNLVTQAEQTLPGLLGSTTTTVSRSYDGLDRLLKETQQTGTVSYTYYANGLRQTMTPSPTNQSAVTYCYDEANRLTSIISSGSCASPGTIQANFNYDGDYRLGAMSLPNGVVASYSYDTASELTGIVYAQGANTLGNLSYTYDNAGRRNSMGGTLGLTSLPTPISSAAFNADDQLTSWGSASYSYDKNGNMTSDGTHTYTWDALNRLTKIQTGSLIKTQTYAFAYDPLDRRFSKAVGSALSNTTTSYLYDGYNKVQELQSSNVTAGYTNGLGVDSSLSRTASGSTASYLSDALGSKIALASSAGSIQTSYQYEPYGETVVSGAASANDVQYTGRENDGSGLYYYRARYYNPVLKRFISEDPVRFLGGSNNYRYSFASPVRFGDPMGLYGINIEWPVFPGIVLSGSAYGPGTFGDLIQGDFGAFGLPTGASIRVGLGIGAGLSFDNKTAPEHCPQSGMHSNYYGEAGINVLGYGNSLDFSNSNLANPFDPSSWSLDDPSLDGQYSGDVGLAFDLSVGFEFNINK